MSASLGQLSRFLAVGVLLLALDTVIYTVTTWAGLPIPWANPLSRASAAAAGYFAHRQLTFAASATSPIPLDQMLRYLLVWCALTAVSTLSLFSIAGAASAQMAIVAKPLIEALLAGISFLMLKHWVYRT